MSKDAQTAQRNTPEFSVSELAHAIKRALEEGFGYVRLRGEVSGFRGPHSSGHCYFSLKDEKARIDAVVWRGVYGKLKVKPEEGMEVIATGKISAYPGSSKYQIVIDALEPAGAGALMALIEERKKKLAAEGLFDTARKRALPFLPQVVGIITSPTGAVIRDMLHGFEERFPTRVMVWPVRVQGETCAAEVAAAIRGFNALAPDGPIPRPDVLIVARGGGSLEDLWGFNEEAVVRAAAASKIPLISAVGHETDWTLIDLAADARAPTPTKAAEWAVPKYSELLQQTGDLKQRLGVALSRTLEAARAHLKAAVRGLPRAEDLVALPRQRFDATEKRLGRALLSNTRAHQMRHTRLVARLAPRLIGARVERGERQLGDIWQQAREGLTRIASLRRTRFERSAARLRSDVVLNRVEAKRRLLDSQANLLASLSYQNVLARGYAVVRDETGAMVRLAAGVAMGQALEVEFADGRVPVVAKSEESVPPTGGGRVKRTEPSQTPKPRGKKRGSQGNLFE